MSASVLCNPTKTILRLSDIDMESELCNYTAAVVVTSDTCYKEPKKDLSGDLVVNSLKSMKFQQVDKYIVPDEKELISEKVKVAAEKPNNILVITVGGTGFCPRDVTPEATSALYDKDCPGIGTYLISEGLKTSPHAALSRLTAGIHGKCLIVNFPGKTKACAECFGCLSRILGHALEQVVGDLFAVNSTHKIQDESPTIVDGQSINQVPDSPSELSAGDTGVKSSNSCNSAHVNTEATVPPPPPISPPPRTKKLTSQQIDQAKIKSSNISSLPIPSSISLPDLKPLKISSQYPLVDYKKALEMLGSLAYLICQTEVSIMLNSSKSAYAILGDVLSESVQSKVSMPSYPVSTMDGFVLNIPQGLNDVITELGINEAELINGIEEFERRQLDVGHCFSFFCYQVNTGGRVPDNSNFAVIPVEKTSQIGKKTITFSQIEPNCYVRKSGSDICEADFLKAGTIIGPVELSLLLSMGCKEVKVFKRPTIGILSTGDELVEFYQYDKSNKTKVINTNGPLLTALFKEKNFPVYDVGKTKDSPQAISLKIHTGLKESDILVITGGASMGSKDHVKDVVEQMGGIFQFGRVNIKPGKPAAMASIMLGGKRKFIFCLPGNPVSAYITCLVLVLPFIEHGLRNHQQNSDVPLTIDAIGQLIEIEIASVQDTKNDSYSFDGRLEFARAKLSKKPGKTHLATISSRQQSSRLLNLKDCDCLILVDPSKKGTQFAVGQKYPALRLRS